MMTRSRRNTFRHCVASTVLCGPAVLIYGGFLVLPAILGFAYSFTDWTGWGTKMHFIGLANFKEMFTDDLFYASLKLTLLETVLIVVFFSFGAMALAVLVRADARRRAASLLSVVSTRAAETPASGSGSAFAGVCMTPVSSDAMSSGAVAPGGHSRSSAMASPRSTAVRT